MTPLPPYSQRTEEQKEKAREAQRRYRASHPDKVQAQNERGQSNRRERYKTDEAYRERCKERSRQTMPSVQREYRARLKDEVFSHYGKICDCCGETEYLFLTLDHANNDGAEHRRKINKAERSGLTAQILLDIIRRGFPPDFKIRCYNCNCWRARNGGVCPHERAKLTEVTRQYDVSTDEPLASAVTPITASGQ